MTARPWAAMAADVPKAVLAAFEAYGLSRDDAVRAYRALFNLMLGHLLNRHPLGHGDLPGEADFEWTLRGLLAGIS